MSLIKKFKLSEKDILHIVNEWYTNGMYTDILQDENGLDLEEICQKRIDDLIREEKMISIDELKKIKSLSHLSEKELKEINKSLYDLAELCYTIYNKEKENE
tara:strand:+ start:275 stop:580 length:306 start_codon:yes stop_codon:yes gene_type:complete